MTVFADGKVEIRRARTSDIAQIRELVDHYSPDRRLLAKASVTLYEDVQEFVVAQQKDVIVGCGALHVMHACLHVGACCSYR